MGNIHKSIFAKIKEYASNPIDEFKKIDKIIKTKTCYYNDTIYDFFEYSFQKNELFRNRFTDLDECLDSVSGNLINYSDTVFNTLDDSTQEQLLDDYLCYCEVIACMYYVTYNKYLLIERIVFDRYFKKDLYIQLLEIIKNGLKSMNHDIKVLNKTDYETVAFKCNPDAECVAEQSSDDLKSEIYNYLGTKGKDIKEKETILHRIIDLLEPLLKKYKENKIVSKVEEYVQLIRHPEIKKMEKQYEWFYKDKDEYLDELFMLCIFVKEYDISKNTINEFEELKKNEIT